MTISFCPESELREERLRKVLSHQKPGASLADIIEAAADELLSRKDPLKREVKARKRKPSDSVTPQVMSAQCATGAGVNSSVALTMPTPPRKRSARH